MAKICENCGKRPLTGMNVSHSNVKTKKRSLPNLQYTKKVLPTGRVIRVRVCTQCLRTLTKARPAKTPIEETAAAAVQ